MAQHGFNQLAGGHGGGGSIDPNDLNVPGTFGSSSYQNNYNNSSNQSNSYSTGSALFGDDELLDGLGSPTDGQSGIHGGGQDFGTMNEMTMGGYTNSIYTTHHGLPMDQNRINGYSNTPEGDPIQSPFAHNFGQYRQMHHPQSFGNSLQSPISYAGSPLTGSDLNQDGGDPNYLNTKVRPRMPTAMARKTSTTRNPLTPKASAAMANLTIGSADSFNAQPIPNGAPHHDKSHSGQWIQTPNSLGSYPGSGFSSPIQPGLHSAQINDILLKGGTSMPAKLGAPLTSSQEAKRKRRRESHNLVERRRRDNINERIQDLSKLVPSHRLEDEKIKKLIQNGTPLSPSLGGISSPSQATSGLAGPGARRAASGNAGNITTGLPIDDKDKGPNKGDILNGAVSWTRDLMWMLHLKLQQQEELANYIMELGGQFPFEPTDDERRMQTELVEAMARNETVEDAKLFVYSRRAGSGLRVPHHTDYRGEPLDGSGRAVGDAGASASPAKNAGLGTDLADPNQFWNDDDDGSGELDFKEEDEYMDLN
ncbi:hypothetical protein RB595_001000 [Gaeumannomyces hyphopodioides]